MLRITPRCDLQRFGHGLDLARGHPPYVPLGQRRQQVSTAAGNYMIIRDPTHTQVPPFPLNNRITLCRYCLRGAVKRLYP